MPSNALSCGEAETAAIHTESYFDCCAKKLIPIQILNRAIEFCFRFELPELVIFSLRFRGLQMIQFECPRVIYPLVLLTFGVHCGVSISLDAGKGKCCIWPVNKVEIHFAKIGIVDYK